MSVKLTSSFLALAKELELTLNTFFHKLALWILDRNNLHVDNHLYTCTPIFWVNYVQKCTALKEGTLSSPHTSKKVTTKSNFFQNKNPTSRCKVNNLLK